MPPQAVPWSPYKDSLVGSLSELTQSIEPSTTLSTRSSWASSKPVSITATVTPFPEYAQLAPITLISAPGVESKSAKFFWPVFSKIHWWGYKGSTIKVKSISWVTKWTPSKTSTVISYKLSTEESSGSAPLG